MAGLITRTVMILRGCEKVYVCVCTNINFLKVYGNERWCLQLENPGPRVCERTPYMPLMFNRF